MNNTLTAGLSLSAATIALLLSHMFLVPNPRTDLGSFTTATATNATAKADIDAVYPLHSESQFARLSAGETHFYLKGPVEGKRIVLIHGITGTWAAAPEFLTLLTQKGFRILVYDLYARGYSSSPGIQYSATDYATQVKDLLDHVGWETASVLGYSLGGGIAVAFADLFRERVDDLVLIAPAGLLKDLPVEAKIVLIPFLGTILAYAVGHALLLKNISDSVDPQLKHDPRMKHMMQTARANVKYNPGLLRGFLETLRNGPVRRMEQAYGRVGDTLHDRVLCIWGSCDTVVEFEALSPVFRKLVPAGTLVELKVATHNVVVETPERVVEPIALFLNRKATQRQ
ncbi:Alpha/Beta hydrolase protein [Chytriomyces cf. hyalinus JEL632]|nr:Alpha/Beta hydrolase protein [Chytriomyces cf. hyalinus JEL632]